MATNKPVGDNARKGQDDGKKDVYEAEYGRRPLHGPEEEGQV